MHLHPHKCWKGGQQDWAAYKGDVLFPHCTLNHSTAVNENQFQSEQIVHGVGLSGVYSEKEKKLVHIKLI